MSLLDDVSIVVTPNGYKAGELYAVVPVPTEGAEEVTNGDFATDSDWSKATGVTISGGNAIFNNSTANNNGIYQAAVFQTNKQYKITAEVSNYSSGNVTAWSGGSQNSTSNESFTGNGTKTWIISTGASNSYFILSSANTNGNFNIDNVSVKEYTSADMDVTRATAATRVDEDGLVNYAEVLGDEEIINGDFATDSDWFVGTGWSYGTNKIVSVNGANYATRQNLAPFVSGVLYKITYTILDYVSGNFNFRFHTLNGATRNANGDYCEYIVPTGDQLYLQGNSNFNGSITNISLKEAARDNVPRIDYTGGGCPHILSEPQRKNEVTYSSDFTQWSNARTTDTANQTISPDGSVNAAYLEQNTGETNAGSIYASVTLIAADYSFSIFAKKKEKDFIVAYDSNANRTYFNISNGTLGNNGSGGTSKIEDYGNGWYRCSVSYTESSAASTNIAWYLGDTNGSTTVTDSGGVYIYGCQVEQGSYTTSYIPTSGSTVTRNQDIFTRDGIGSLINSTEGVLFVEMAALSDDTSITGSEMSISDGTANNNLRILYSPSTSLNSLFIRIDVGGVRIVTFNYTGVTIKNFNKIAVKWKVNDFALWINGIEVLTDLSGVSFSSSTLSNIDFSYPTGINNLQAKVRQLQIFKTALSDPELVTLTT